MGDRDRIRVEATVKRVFGGFVSLAVEGWASSTVRWSGTPATVGQKFFVSGVSDERLTTDQARGFRILEIEAPGGVINLGEAPAGPTTSLGRLEFAMLLESPPTDIARFLSTLSELLDEAKKLIESGIFRGSSVVAEEKQKLEEEAVRIANAGFKHAVAAHPGRTLSWLRKIYQPARIDLDAWRIEAEEKDRASASTLQAPSNDLREAVGALRAYGAHLPPPSPSGIILEQRELFKSFPPVLVEFYQLADGFHAEFGSYIVSLSFLNPERKEMDSSLSIQTKERNPRTYTYEFDADGSIWQTHACRLEDPGVGELPKRLRVAETLAEFLTIALSPDRTKPKKKWDPGPLVPAKV